MVASAAAVDGATAVPVHSNSVRVSLVVEELGGGGIGETDPDL